jgi:hypothetical protein
MSLALAVQIKVWLGDYVLRYKQRMRSWRASTLVKDAAPELILGQVAEG